MTHQVFLFVLALSAVPVMYRLLKGPALADRVAAFDVLTCLVMGMLTIFAVKTGSVFYIEVILIMSFVVFLGAIAFAFYMTKRRKKVKYD